ncbi:MAG: hypothetical protein PHQ50_01450 [Eubacteriales bacterium]|nr:hypothetical protein [Eubacteriales bacterium]MDD3350010.1 hypothetical protein [Eubacteriales bacterium]
MNNYLACFFLILLCVVIGGKLFNGDTNSIRAAMAGTVTTVTTEISEIK